VSSPAPPPGVAVLRQARTVRERAAKVLAATRADGSSFWQVHDAALPTCADLVAQVTRQRYPDLNIPYHSRWRHFEPQGVDRKAWLDTEFMRSGATAAEVARSRFDLVITSVLLDAGAGSGWQFVEPGTGQTHARSEGLGVASLHAFLNGTFSSQPGKPLQADAQGLQNLSVEALAHAFQVNDANPLVGLEGRCALLRRLGEAVAAQPEVFAGSPGGLYDHLLAKHAGAPTAGQVLTALLEALSDIWPSGQRFEGTPVGDCWPCALAGPAGPAAGWQPFHKLSQWLTYSLLEPLAWAGVPVAGLDELTGLPEYRNGGLLLDMGVIVARSPFAGELQSRAWQPGEPPIVEWRALTVALLDELAPMVRERLGRSAEEMPLACMLEGGTWAAGRETAANLRGGLPPFSVDSDGTVF
jgi:hypothetical protein